MWIKTKNSTHNFFFFFFKISAEVHCKTKVQISTEFSSSNRKIRKKTLVSLKYRIKYIKHINSCCGHWIKIIEPCFNRFDISTIAAPTQTNVHVYTHRYNTYLCYARKRYAVSAEVNAIEREQHSDQKLSIHLHLGIIIFFSH